VVYLKKRKTTIFLNKSAMRKLGVNKSSLWENNVDNLILSAPLEVHFSITNDCPLHCSGCYANGGEISNGNLTDNEIFHIIDILSEMKVFQIAFGGGEPFSHPHFFDFVYYTVKRGIIPNVTTNGFYINKEIAEKCKIFGSINVSLDGVGRENYLRFRGSDGWDYAKNALILLKKAGCNAGINLVLTRKNLPYIDEVFLFAKDIGVKNVLLLRFKPKGRGKQE
jgi:MoaA/NifB/PqqE/SkfB family radical SAM enzyme